MAAEFNRRLYDIGQNIRRIRLEKGMSQTDLALAMDTTKAAVSRWETGERVIRLDSLLRLADVLNVPLPDILKEDTPGSDGWDDLIVELKMIPEQDQPFVVKAVRTLIRGLMPAA